MEQYCLRSGKGRGFEVTQKGSRNLDSKIPDLFSKEKTLAELPLKETLDIPDDGGWALEHLEAGGLTTGHLEAPNHLSTGKGTV